MYAGVDKAYRILLACTVAVEGCAHVIAWFLAWLKKIVQTCLCSETQQNRSVNILVFSTSCLDETDMACAAAIPLRQDLNPTARLLGFHTMNPR